MADEVIMVVKFRVKRSDAESFKEEMDDIIDDFVDGNLAVKEGEIEQEEIR